MSWSGTAVADENGIVSDLSTSPPHEACDSHVREQIDAAVATVGPLVHSGSIGGHGKSYDVRVSGHGNPGHEPVDGWVNDYVTVTVTQKTAVAEEPAEPEAEEQPA